MHCDMKMKHLNKLPTIKRGVRQGGTLLSPCLFNTEHLIREVLNGHNVANIRYWYPDDTIRE